MHKPLIAFLKIAFSIALFVVISIKSQAQNYSFSASSGTFTPITGSIADDQIESDDEVSISAIPVGFTFTYMGTAYTTLKASSNGFLNFNTALLNSLPENDDLALTNHPILAPLWDDLSGDAGSASYITTGISPNRIFTYEWLNYKWNNNALSPNISFQVKLYETTNKIEFIYDVTGGALNSASASIGLIRSTAQFYSLTNSSSSPALDPAGVINISAKPAANQMYTFTTATAPIAPTGQANTITAPINTGSGLGLSWVNGNGSYRVVFMKEISAAETAPVANNSAYTPSTTFGLGSVVGVGWRCVYNGTGSSVNVTNLNPASTYRVQVLEYNGLAGSQKYLTTTVGTNPVNINTAVAAPGAPVSTITMYNISATSLTFDINEQSGSQRAVFVKAATSSVVPAAVNNTTYTANTVFGSGSQIGSSGWYCVFNGASTTQVTVTGLAGDTDYIVHVVDYNGTAGSEKYNVTSVTNNPVSTKTFIANPGVTYAFSTGTTAFTPITGTNLDISVNSITSASVPLGFTFRFQGVPLTHAQVSSEGFITFNPYAANFPLTPTDDLSASLLRPLIAPLWDDLSGVGGVASYVTTGSIGSRICTIEFLNWRWNSGAAGSTISFQVKLYEADDKIEFIYRQEATAANFASASFGIAFPNTGSGGYISLNNTSASPTASSTVNTNNIGSKPATGQLYAFTPSGGPATSPQSINFAALPVTTVGDAPFALTATATSGLAVSYTSSNPAVATVSGSTVTIIGGGTTVITASQSGNGTYDAAPDVPQTLTVNKLSQTITFNALPPKTVISAPFNLAATASSGLTVTYVSSDLTVATVSGNTVTIIGAGTTTITASQAGNSSYVAAASVPQTLTVTKLAQTITFTGPIVKNINDVPFSLTASATSGLAVTYVSLNTSVATISGNTVTIVGAGTATIRASQSGNGTYNAAADVDQTLTVNKLSQTITFNALAPKLVTDPAFNLTATSSSTLGVTYVSLNTAVATISGNTVTIVGAGTATIRASQAGDGTYNPAADVDQTLTVNKLSQTITFGALPAKLVNDPDFALGASASSGLTVTYVSSNTAVATIIGNMVSIVGAGTTTITASQAGDATYNVAMNVGQTLTVNKLAQTITFGALADRSVIDAPFALTATASSGLPVSYISSNTAVATISGNTVTIVGGGTTTITAMQAGDATYNAAVDVLQNLTVKLEQVITFGALPDKTFGDAPFTLTATVTSGLTISYISSNTAVATISGDVVTIVGAGTTNITAMQPGDGNFNPAADVTRTLTVKFSQTITFGALAPKTFNDVPFTLSASASSGLTVSYSSSNTTVATVSGNTVTIIGVGSTTITAMQPGDASNNPAPNVLQTLTVGKASQAITFAPIPARDFNDGNFTLAATVNTGFTVFYSSDNPGVATISGNTVTVVGVGVANITASQPGGTNYNAAPNVVRALTINKGDQTITFGALASKSLGDPAFSLTATASSNLAVTYSSSNPAVASISGTALTIVGSGTTTITAFQGGNSIFNAAPSVGQSFKVKTAQSITFNMLPSKTFGNAPFVLVANASSGLPVSFVSSNPAVAVISGNTVTIVGAGIAIITASQSGDANIGAAPPVSQTLLVNKVSQTITFTALSPKTMADLPFDLTATATSGLGVTYSTTGDEIIISGNKVTIVKPGSVTIKAMQPGNTTYSAAPSIDRTFCINPSKPTITTSNLETETPVLTSSSTTGNQWLKDGKVILSETNETFTVTGPGVYSVRVNIEGCASPASDNRPIVITGVSEENNSNSAAVTVYPNPIDNEFTIDASVFSAQHSVAVTLVDLSGKQLQTWIGKNKFSCNMSSFKSGNYVLYIKGGKTVITKQITKK